MINRVDFALIKMWNDNGYEKYFYWEFYLPTASYSFRESFTRKNMGCGIMNAGIALILTHGCVAGAINFHI